MRKTRTVIIKGVTTWDNCRITVEEKCREDEAQGVVNKLLCVAKNNRERRRESLAQNIRTLSLKCKAPSRYLICSL